MTPGHEPVSEITGRRQAIVLTAITWLSGLTAVLALLLPDPVRMWAGIAAVGGVTSAPLLRVAWLIVRWWQEGDLRFVAMGAALIGVVAIGAAIAMLMGS